MFKMFLAVTALCLSSCANLLLNPPLSGRVVDEADKPIPGAFVVIGWLERHYSGSACRYVSGTRTDELGRFSITDWKGPGSGSVDEYVVRVYAPGRAMSPRIDRDLRLLKASLPTDERVRELQTIARALCDEQPGSKSVVAPMYLEIACELDRITGERAKQVASNYRRLAADIMLANMAAPSYGDSSGIHPLPGVKLVIPPCEGVPASK